MTEMTTVKHFHFSDVLSITTGRLVSTRHMEGVYEILNWMTQDELFTHQLPRAAQECAPVLCSLYPELGKGALGKELDELTARVKYGESKAGREVLIANWLDAVFDKTASVLPYDSKKCLPVPMLRDGQHLHINPIEEARAMFGDEKVVVVNMKDKP